MPDGLLRIPHGWWKPEMEQGLGKLSGALRFGDSMLCPDDEDYLDREQGIPHLKGFLVNHEADSSGLDVFWLQDRVNIGGRVSRC